MAAAGLRTTATTRSGLENRAFDAAVALKRQEATGLFIGFWV